MSRDELLGTMLAAGVLLSIPVVGRTVTKAVDSYYDHDRMARTVDIFKEYGTLSEAQASPVGSEIKLTMANYLNEEVKITHRSDGLLFSVNASDRNLQETVDVNGTPLSPLKVVKYPPVHCVPAS